MISAKANLVVRDPKWIWNDQDGGSGNLGIYIKKSQDDWHNIEWLKGGDSRTKRYYFHKKYR